jgi:UDP-glucose 4-epimerase
MAVLVTGAAGYIGSHCADVLIRRGFDVVVIDNLSTGHAWAIPKKARFYKGDLTKRRFVEDVFNKESIDAVIHFAAFSLVGESEKDPGKYFYNNIVGTENVLEAMRAHGVSRIVFSSTAAVYGNAEQVPILEGTEKRPTSAYGETKLSAERMLAAYQRAYGTTYVALRYFNVAGASEHGHIGEAHEPETHLIPLVLMAALGKRENITVYGTDYDTSDGTCIRDYVHVEDLVEGHLLALQYLERGGESQAFNLGIGKGFSVLEVIEAAKRVTGRDIPVVYGPRREGDPAVLVASGQKAKDTLYWRPEYVDIDRIIQSAWTWHCGDAENLGHTISYDF